LPWCSQQINTLALCEKNTMEIYLGFDAGGKGKFGWALCIEDKERLRIIHTGNADHAQGALLAVKSCLPSQAIVTGAGIDAPLFWVANGSRHSDLMVRRAIKNLGSKSPGGTLQQLNSLRGACLVQGPLIAKLLVDEFSSIKITETHPKALLFLLGLANAQNPPNRIGVGDLGRYIQATSGSYSEHERDSLLGAITSIASVKRQDHWRDLTKEEKGLLVPFEYTPEYWMPWNLV
jgi:hypothetical protein